MQENLNQGRDHAEPWQPVAITIAIIAVIFSTLWIIL